MASYILELFSVLSLKLVIEEGFETENNRFLIYCVFLFCRLSLCEKALAEYLETKRLAFPRFYFVSSADLLDILSKGNIPIEVSIVYVYCIGLCYMVYPNVNCCFL